MRVLSVVGARPQFIKSAVVSQALADARVDEVLIHTGQHYDVQMSDIFFRELRLRRPDHHLGIGSGSHGDQTGRMLNALERVMSDVAPDRVLVYGDTNSTLAGALAAAKLRLPVDHVEAGLRSHDRDMPEEINRVLTDHVSDELFCPTPTAVENLATEGIVDGVLHTGDVMLDLALQTRHLALSSPLPPGIATGGFFLATVHRASNTDDAERLREVIDALDDVACAVADVVLPMHPRLARALDRTGVCPRRVRLVDPIGYIEMQGLLLHARGVITDSGGVQKEALFHGRRCLTIRDSTEWIESLTDGMNELVADELDTLATRAARLDTTLAPSPTILNAFGGGRAGSRIAAAILARGSARRRWSGQTSAITHSS